MSKKYLYYFSEGNDAFGGDKVTMKNTLGGKGAGLAEMTAAGMPVPQGFTITTDACTQYYADGRQINDEITADIFEHLKGLEEITGKKFGDNQNPLLVSVRSGARQSMPGMMDTILNLGLNDEAVEGLAKKTGNARFAYDCYRRFVQMFADVVMMVPKSLFEVEIDKMKEAKGVKNDVDLTADDLKELVGTFKKIYEENEGRPFPQDPRDQLIEAVKAVFRSWDNPRANVYRKMNEIPYEWGTAVNVQQMAFGNSGDRSGTGVAFTRDPATGAKKLMGEYLINAQGEDVVAGVRTPSPISHLHEQMPEVYDQFVEIATRLENYFRDMQDMEFTIEDGHLYMLQTRNGKRTAQAALQIACDLVDEGMITEQEAVLRVEPKQLDTLLHPQFDAAALKAAEVVGKGLAASPGSACGQIVFTAEEAEERTIQMLNLYADFCEDFLAIPVVRGQKTDKEKFAGAEATYTIESLMHDGKALQSGTSHNFGDGFAKAFNIQYLDKDNKLKYVHQTSWGMTTRMVGAIIMVHGDNNGLVLPPKVAPTQVMIVPIQQAKEGVLDKAFEVKEVLSNFRVKVDDSDKSPGWKFSESEMRGIPVRVEIGPRDIAENQAVLVRRDTHEKITVSLDEIAAKVGELLETIHHDMFERAKAHRDSHTYVATTLDEMKEIAENKPGFIKAMWCGNQECEDKLKEVVGVTSRCIPFNQEHLADTCVCCGKPATKMVYWGKAY